MQQIIGSMLLFLILYARYLDNRVFVSLANGDICVYLRDGGKLVNRLQTANVRVINRFIIFAATSWNTCLSHCLSIGTVTSPVTKLLNVNGKLWCSIQGIIKVLDTESFSVCDLRFYIRDIDSYISIFE